MVFTRDGVEYEIVVAVMSLWISKIGVVTEVTSATESRSEENKFPSDSAYDWFRRVRSSENQIDEFWKQKGPGGGRGELFGSIFAGYVPLASESPYPIIVYSLANYRPNFSHFGAKM